MCILNIGTPRIYNLYLYCMAKMNNHSLCQFICLPSPIQSDINCLDKECTVPKEPFKNFFLVPGFQLVCKPHYFSNFCRQRKKFWVPFFSILNVEKLEIWWPTLRPRFGNTRLISIVSNRNKVVVMAVVTVIVFVPNKNN